MSLRKGPKDPSLPNLHYECEFKKYLCPLYIVFSIAQKKKASHHHPLGGTSFLLWYIDSTLSCKKKKFCGGQCRMTLFIIMMSWFFFCFSQFNSFGARVGMQACFKLFCFGFSRNPLLLINSRNTNSPFHWFWILTVRVYPMFFLGNWIFQNSWL